MDINKYREIIMYLIFGVLAFVVSMVTYISIIHFLKNALISNIFSWIITVSFAYVTNRIWVFNSTVHSFSGIINEMVHFFSGRIATLLIEEAILFIGIDCLDLNEIITKLAGQVVVIVGNYIASKFFCFK